MLAIRAKVVCTSVLLGFPEYGDGLAGTLVAQKALIHRVTSVIVTLAKAGVQELRTEYSSEEPGFRLPPE
jgi:hypothetical protein